MDALIEYMLDENTKTSDTIKIDIANRDNTILVGNQQNQNLLALTFYQNNTILDIDNRDGKFDAISSIANTSANGFLQFNIDNVTINPDLTINLKLKNCPIKELRIRPDGISKVNTKGAETQVYYAEQLLNTSLPKNLVSLKSRFEGLQQIPTQLFNNINNFDNAKSNTFHINDKDILIAKVDDKFFVSDGEYLKTIDNSKTLTNTKKDANTVQFCFETENKNLTKISDNSFNDICTFLEINPTDASHQGTNEQFLEASEIQTIKEQKYIKSQKNPDGSVLSLQKKSKEKKSEKVSNQSTSPKPESKPKASPEKITIDLTYPVKLFGFALFFVGLFGGGLLPVILGICIGGCGYAFSAPLEKIKVGSIKKPNFNFLKRNKSKQSKTVQQEKLSDKNLVEQRITFLNNLQTKYTGIGCTLQAMYEQNTNINNKLQQKLKTTVDANEQYEVQQLLNQSTENLAKIKNNLDEYNNCLNLYTNLIKNSAKELQTATNFIDFDENDLYEDFEQKYEMMIQQRNACVQLEQQKNQLLEKQKNCSNASEKQSISEQIEQLKTKISAQKMTESIASKQTEDAKNLYNNTKASKKVFADNMDGSLTYNNIQNGLKVLNSYKTEIEDLTQQGIQSISENQYTQDLLSLNQ